MPTPYIEKLSKEGKGSVESLEKKWDEAKAQAKKEGKADNYAYITSIFQNMIHAGTLPMKINASKRLVADELTNKQKKLDINEDGKIDGQDLKKVRQGELNASERLHAYNPKKGWQSEIVTWFSSISVHPKVSPNSDENSLIINFKELNRIDLGDLVNITAITRKHSLISSLVQSRFGGISWIFSVSQD